MTHVQRIKNLETLKAVANHVDGPVRLERLIQNCEVIGLLLDSPYCCFIMLPSHHFELFLIGCCMRLSKLLRHVSTINMSVGFGFSVSDFIAGIQLVREVISSLQSGAGSALDYQTLIYELFTLERALLEVKSLRFEECQIAQLDALKGAATQCQSTIDRFLTKIRKHQPSLNAQGSGSKVRDGIRKIQWPLCDKTDLEVFKAEVRGHAGSINLLLATVQL